MAIFAGTDAQRIVEALSAEEMTQLADYEAQIQTGLRAFYRVGTALIAIRDARLYRADHRTFEAYCAEKWGLSLNYADRQMAAMQVVINLQQSQNVPIGTLLPANEAQARPLASLPPAEQVRAWETAVTTAPESGITAQHVQGVVDTIKAEANPTPLFDFAPDRAQELSIPATQAPALAKSWSDILLLRGNIGRPLLIADAFWCVVAPDTTSLNGAVYAVRVYPLDGYIDERSRRLETGEVAFPTIVDFATWQTEVRERRRLPENVFGLKVVLNPTPRPDEVDTSVWWVLTDYKARIVVDAELPAATETSKVDEPVTVEPAREERTDPFPTDDIGMAALQRSFSGYRLHQGQCAPPVLLDKKLWTTLTLGLNRAHVAEVVERHFWQGEAFAVQLWKKQVADKERLESDYQGLAVKCSQTGKVYVLTGLKRLYVCQGKAEGKADEQIRPAGVSENRALASAVSGEITGSRGVSPGVDETGLSDPDAFDDAAHDSSEVSESHETAAAVASASQLRVQDFSPSQAEIDVTEAVADMQTALDDVCLDYGDVLEALKLGAYDADDQDEYTDSLPTTVEGFCDYWPPVLRGLFAYAREAMEARLVVQGDDLTLLAKLAARKRPGQTEPISTAAYLHELIVKNADMWEITLEPEEAT